MADRRCLVLSCSQAKRGNDGLLPAIERYNGPAIRVVRHVMGLNAPYRPRFLARRHIPEADSLILTDGNYVRAIWAETDMSDPALVAAQCEQFSPTVDLADLDRSVLTAGRDSASVSAESQRLNGLLVKGDSVDGQ